MRNILLKFQNRKFEFHELVLILLRNTQARRTFTIMNFPALLPFVLT